MPALPSNERTARASIAAHESWARTTDRAARTANARAARRRKYLERAAELHPGATPEVIERAADHLEHADLKRMALASARARRIKRQAAATTTGGAA